ncbi:DNA binding protein, putative [Ricinus communis]|uniref:DNA binding protein, putative n=1 Tax=Ricinus communis TaxID=3988 RepID=B9RZG5_RICCO|nr:DNA binding protein, putative [Ricinus communis]
MDGIFNFEHLQGLPLKFVKEYGNELANIAKLTVSSNGRVWRVGLTKERNHTWYLHNGWHEFASYHSICYGYFLVFEYKGMSNFKVFIFDMSACEIPYWCNKDPPSNMKQ